MAIFLCGCKECHSSWAFLLFCDYANIYALHTQYKSQLRLSGSVRGSEKNGEKNRCLVITRAQNELDDYLETINVFILLDS